MTTERTDWQAEGASMLICEAALDGRCDEDCHHAKPHTKCGTCGITCHGFGIVPVGSNCVPVEAAQPPATPPDRPTGLPHLQPITDLPNTAGLHALAAEQRASRDAARSKQARENATAGQRMAARMAAQKAEADARQTSEQASQQAGREITAEFARLAEEARGVANGRVAGEAAAQPPQDPLAGAKRAAEVLVERGWDVGQDDNLRHKCPKCARAREYGWRYCPTCGERLRGTAVRDALEDLAEAIEAANAEHHARPERT